MNPNHQKFINEYLATGNKIEAYRKAYPNAKETSLTNAANRLLQREDIAAIIRQSEERALKKAEAALEKRVQAELLDLYETQLLLTQIARGQHTTTKPVKENGNWTTIDVKPTHNIILRAINTFFRISTINKASGSSKSKGLPQPEKSPPPWGELEGALPSCEQGTAPPHPFGNIYPPTYPGPYYDPGDPNTKEKMQKLALQPLTGKHTPETITTNNNKISVPPASVPNTFGRVEGDVNTRGEINNTTTTNNNAQQKETTPPSEGKVPAGPGGYTQQGLTQTTTQNPGKQQHPSRIPKAFGTEKTTKDKPSPSGGAGGGFSPYVQRMLLCDQLRKEGWQTIEEASNEVYEIYIRNQCRQTYTMLKQFEKLRKARNLPPDERAQVEKETGWQYHPQHSFMLKRKRH